MSLTHTLRLLFAAFCSACIISCGGGGGSSAVNSALLSPALATQKGNFIDSAVTGIGYKTATQNGVTDEFGGYIYVPGEQVTFSIGAITLPPVTALSTVTPLSMSTTGSLSDPVVTNVAYLLQSIDSNNNPNDGLLIDSRVASLATTNLNFNQSSTDFAADPAVKSLIAAVDKLKGTPTSVTTTSAVANFGQTLLGLVDSSSIPTPGCDQINTQTVISRTNYSTNFWANVVVKPSNKYGFAYGGAFRNIGSNPGGAFAWYQPKANSNEILIAQKSGRWDPTYSPTYDIWLQHSENPNIVMRIAVSPVMQETSDMPKYVGTSIYLIYIGPAGTYLDFQFASGNVPVVYFSFIGNNITSYYTGTAGLDGTLGNADDGFLPAGMNQIWLQHTPGQANYPPNMHIGATTPYGRTLSSTECFLNPGGSVQIWGSPSTTSDLLFSPNSLPNFWGHDAPLYTDQNGYQGAMGIRNGVQSVSVVKSN